jgi:hypothetical protein
MAQTNPPGDAAQAQTRALARGIRLDLLIAVCALLISSLATAASWWQTRVIEEQLSAQVWPYVSVNEDLSESAVKISIVNNGLGPAILRSMVLSIDGKPKSSFVDVLHSILGPELQHRRPRNELMNLNLSSPGAGGVLRAGDSNTLFEFTSKHFARQLAVGTTHLDIRTCYCAIIPGRCWLTDSSVSADPKQLGECPVVTNDWLHAPVMQQLNGAF